MDYLLQNPIEHEGNIYDIGLFHLSCAPMVRGNDYTTAVNLQVIPARRTDESMEMLYSHALKVELTNDIKNSPSSMDILSSYAQVSEVIVGLAVRMGLIVVPTE